MIQTQSRGSQLAIHLAKIAAAIALLTLSAKVTVPFYPVPMTMQIAAILLIASLGGLRFSAETLGGYLALGAAGLPVFAGTPEKGIGLAYMTGTTGGYLLGFFLAALLVGWAADRFGKKAMFLAMPAGVALIYVFGLAWLAQFVPSDKLLEWGMTPFLLGDALKIAIALLLTFLAPAALSAWIKGAR